MIQWNKAPFFRLIIPFIISILLAIHLQYPLPFLNYIGVLLILILATLSFITIPYFYRWIYGLLLNIIFLIIGYQLTINKIQKFSPDHFSKYIRQSHTTINPSNISKNFTKPLFIAKVTEPPLETEKTYKTIIKVIAIRHFDGRWYETQGEAIIYFEKNDKASKLKYGDKLLINAELTDIKPPQNPQEFDYRKYLERHFIYQQAYVKTEQWSVLCREQTNDSYLNKIISYLNNYLNNSRAKLLTILRNNLLNPDEYSIASALLLGYKAEMSDELISLYSRSGLMHLLAVSGMHVGIIYIVLNTLLFFLKRYEYGRLLRLLLIIIFLVLYAGLTGFPPSVLRATLMFSFILIGQSLMRYHNPYNSLACSAFILLLFNPYMITDVGFQLSYLAVFGIVSIYPKIYGLFKIKNLNIRPSFLLWFLGQIWALLALSISAQIATFPLGLYYFHQFPNFFFLSNLIAIPLVYLITILGIVLLIVSPLQTLSVIIGKILMYLINFLNHSIDFITKLPYSYSQGISITPTETIIIYLLITSSIIFLLLKNAKWLKLSLLFIILLLCFQFVENYNHLQQKKFTVYNISNATGIDFIYGRKNLLIADSSLLSNEKKLSYHVYQNWWKHDITNGNKIALNSVNTAKIFDTHIMVLNNFIQFGNKRIAIINESPVRLDKVKYRNKSEILRFFNNDIRKKLKIDYAIITGNPNLKIKDLLCYYDVNQIIFDSSNSLWKVKKWIAECKEFKMSYYAVGLERAFEEEI